ncbi:hypothetical protein D3C86_1861850 [compost metagenome]
MDIINNLGSLNIKIDSNPSPPVINENACVFLSPILFDIYGKHSAYTAETPLYTLNKTPTQLLALA